MKKTFPLHIPGKQDAKVVEAIKLELTKYVKRERRKRLPPGVDFWNFACKVGTCIDNARSIPLPELPREIETLARRDVPELYVEILASPGYRVKNTAPALYRRRES
jgi:hypothetical protein